ncbi:MAG: TetR/AcrR family transcriptional regulator [Bacteroidaceae bacterium]|nr:TetR/AcrR family transcriptional regulator [Bacteroidaceae bacterium]MBR1788437.1 TetR/AcrR family transcriptional regulator [Bacteroidaceae bacterium]
MGLVKTREKLIDVARQLFAKKGLDDTTMNDIAIASGKGRRTLYTYFKSKDDVFYAVVEEEMRRMGERLKLVASKDLEPEDKLVQLVYTHLSLIKEVVMRNGNLRAEFFRNIWLVEKVRKKFDQTEVDLITQIIMQGIRQGKFDVTNIRLSVDIIHYCIRGLEVPYIYGRLGMSISVSRPMVKQVIHRAMAKTDRPDEQEQTMQTN